MTQATRQQPGPEVELRASSKLKGKETMITQIPKNSYIFVWKYMGQVVFFL